MHDFNNHNLIPGYTLRDIPYCHSNEEISWDSKDRMAKWVIDNKQRQKFLIVVERDLHHMLTRDGISCMINIKWNVSE